MFCHNPLFFKINFTIKIQTLITSIIHNRTQHFLISSNPKTLIHLLQYNTLLLIPYLHPSQSICLISYPQLLAWARVHTLQFKFRITYYFFPTFRRIKITPHLNMNTNKAMFPKWKRKLVSPPLFLAARFPRDSCNVRSFRSAVLSVCCHGRC